MEKTERSSSGLRKDMASRLRDARAAMNLQSQQVAAVLEIPISTYSRYENNFSGIQLKVLARLHQRLGITASYLVSGQLTDLNSDLRTKIVERQRKAGQLADLSGGARTKLIEHHKGRGEKTTPQSD